MVSSHREGGKIKHTVLFNLGRLDSIEGNPSFQNLAFRLLEISKAKSVTNLDDISEAEISNWGYIVYKRIWEQFGLDSILAKIKKKGKTQFDLSKSSFLMVANHLLAPKSKLATYAGQDRYTNLSPVELNELYRSLDILAKHKERLEEEMYLVNRNLFNMEVDIVFYDVTTFSFSSVRADTLKDFGFSKDSKPGKVQVVLGLLIDCHGRPIGYELFPGNTFDGKTLEAALEAMEGRFGIRKVIIVADKGINSKLNLKMISDRGYKYIFASRIKSASKKIKDLIFTGDYTKTQSTYDTVRYKVNDWINEFKADGKKYELAEKLIITYSEKRAKKDRADRERLIEKAGALLKNKAKIRQFNKRGGKKYIKDISKDSDWIFDIEAVLADQRFDGYYGIQTNDMELGPEKVMDAYHSLWKIEQSFRIMKSTLEVKPIFHWTELRIKGHFVICFLAFLLERNLEFRLKKSGEEASPEKIREAINSLNFAKVSLNGRKYFIKTKSSDLAKKILLILKIKPPKNITPVDEFRL
jgi:transposase